MVTDRQMLEAVLTEVRGLGTRMGKSNGMKVEWMDSKARASEAF